VPVVPFRAPARRRLHEDVADQLRDAILDSRFATGAKLPPERELAIEFRVNRTSVREAIQGLVTLGMIERRGNRSYVVEHLPAVQLDGADGRKRRVAELFEVRQVVEIPIARLAACRATDDDRAQIVVLAEGFGPDMRLEEFRHRDREFHSAIAAACGNRTLAEVYGKILDSLFESREFDELLGARSNRKAVREIIRNASDAHRAIARAISAGEWAQTIEAAERHLDQVEDQMISRMI